MGYTGEKAAEYRKKHYEKHKGKYKQSRTKIRDTLRAFLLEEKSKPCADCGGSFPAVCMDFHHIKDKSCDISQIRALTPRLIKEIDKCVLLCANCHRVRHSLTIGDD